MYTVLVLFLSLFVSVLSWATRGCSQQEDDNQM